MTDKHDDMPALPTFEQWASARRMEANKLDEASCWIRTAYEDALAAGQRAAAERAAQVCMEQAQEPECPERATYCAAAIRREFGIDQEQV